MNKTENWIDRGLADLRERDLLRRDTVYPSAGAVVEVGGRPCLNLASNNYLGLAGDPRLGSAARGMIDRYGCGATASRLVTGTLPCHEELERRLAALKGRAAALLFGSGYLANAGVLPALVGRGDWILADRLCHASLVDAAVLSRATLRRFEHNNPEHLRRRLAGRPAGGRCLVVTESVFSMDGDLAPLPRIAALCREYEAMLMVDEAHATGVFGPGGAGLVRAAGPEASVDLVMATLSKALGGYGGFVACTPALRELLVNRARAYIYTTAPPPAAAGAALAALDAIAADPEMGARLLRRAADFRRRLRRGGLNLGDSRSQIVPLMVGAADAALALSRRLRERGVLAVAIRPPTVPRNTARLRLSLSLAHTPDQLAEAAEIVIACAREVLADGPP